MLAFLRKALSLTREPIPSPLNGIMLAPFDDDQTEPYRTLSRAMRDQLVRRGVAFSNKAEWKCELDWEKLGGAQLRLKLAARVGTLLVETTVREGFPLREVVDFDLEATYRMSEEKKLILFLTRGAEKLVERLEYRYVHDLGSRS